MVAPAPAPDVAAPDVAAPAVGLYAALQDLKRQHPAHYGGESIATRLFRRAWRRLLGGVAARERQAGGGGALAQLADDTAAESLAMILLPGCDAGFWPHTPVPRREAARLLRDAIDGACDGAVGEPVRGRLHAAADRLAARYYAGEAPAANVDAAASADADAVLPPALELLTRQPRAGATRPGFQRLVLAPAELHGEHCLLTAVYAYLAAEDYGADRGVSFLAGLAHHLHNALLPDCGFAGEILLGDHLDGVIDAGRERALAQLPAALAEATRAALRHHETIAAPEGRAISAGDVLDRVLDVKWRTRAAAVTDRDILGDLDLVHDGPLKSFQMDLLNRHGLWGNR